VGSGGRFESVDTTSPFDGQNPKGRQNRPKKTRYDGGFDEFLMKA
jgi:hypothetical protein